MKSKEPAKWRELLKRLKIFREHNKAPVDSMGMEAIADISETKLLNASKRRKLSESQCIIKEFHALVGLMLSSQTNDKITSATVVELIQDNGLTPHSLLALSDERLKKLIGKVGFFNKKADFLKRVSRIIIQDYNGRVPATHEELIKLPGVGNKMAHLFLQICHDKVEGISVDVHLFRISHRWKWVDPHCNTPDKTSAGLQEWLPRRHWKEINPLVVGFGQLICEARKPKCGQCPLSDICPSVRTGAKEEQF